MKTKAEIDRDIERLDRVIKELREHLKETKREREELERLKDAEITYENAICSECGEPYLFKDMKGFLGPNIKRYLVVTNGKVAQMFFGSACDECVAKIWTNSCETLLAQGYVKKQGEAYIPLPEYR